MNSHACRLEEIVVCEFLSQKLTNKSVSYTHLDVYKRQSLFSAQGFRPDLPIYNDNGEFDMSTGQANPESFPNINFSVYGSHDAVNIIMIFLIGVGYRVGLTLSLIHILSFNP